MKRLLIQGFNNPHRIPPFLIKKLREFYQTLRLDMSHQSPSKLLTPLLQRYLHSRYEFNDDPYQYTLVDPTDIEYMQLSSPQTSYNYKGRLPWSIHEPEKGSFHPQLYTGITLPGNWDKYKKPYRFDRVYRGICEHYQDNIPWEETVLGQHYLISEEIGDKDSFFETEIRKTEQLYESIQENGLLTPYQSDQKDPTQPIHWPPCGITINIGRDGELIYNNFEGHRRLAITRMLGLDQIPVLIVAKHDECVS